MGIRGITPPGANARRDRSEYWKRSVEDSAGLYPALAAQGMSNTGSENYGGPIVTASNVLFIGATVYDKKLRAFDSQTGELLWQTVLPNAGVATPVTYMVNGKQYVVIAAGGGRILRLRRGASMSRFPCLSSSACVFTKRSARNVLLSHASCDSIFSRFPIWDCRVKSRVIYRQPASPIPSR